MTLFEINGDYSMCMRIYLSWKCLFTLLYRQWWLGGCTGVRRAYRRVVVLLCMLMAVTAYAADDVYSASVSVPNRSDAALEEAASRALTEILVRVSGDKAVPKIPHAASVIAGAHRYMSLYSFEEKNEKYGATNSVALELNVQFDADLIESILRQSKATFWIKSRPPVLLWMVVDELPSRRFATFIEEGELLRDLSARFADRGVKLRLPLLDLRDTVALPPEVVWQEVTPQIMAASERYGTHHVLIGRYVQLSNGQQVIDWLYFDTRGRDSIQVQGDDLTSILAEVVDMVVDAMATQYAVKLGLTSSLDRLTVFISEIQSFDDYRDVLHVFDEIAVIDDIQVIQIDGDCLSLWVSGVSTVDALVRLFPPKSRLVLDGTPEDGSLYLRWEQP